MSAALLPGKKNLTDSDRRDALAAAIRARLRPLCVDWPEDLFASMVQRLTEITLKYEGRGVAMYDRRSTELLVSELKAALERNEAARERDDTDGPGHATVSLLLPLVLEVMTKLPTRIV